MCAHININVEFGILNTKFILVVYLEEMSSNRIGKDIEKTSTDSVIHYFFKNKGN